MRALQIDATVRNESEGITCMTLFGSCITVDGALRGAYQPWPLRGRVLHRPDSEVAVVGSGPPAHFDGAQWLKEQA